MNTNSNFPGGPPDIERIQAATNSRLGKPRLPQTVKLQPREEVGQSRPFLAVGFVAGFIAGWCAVWNLFANASRRAPNRGSHTDAVHVAHAQPVAVHYANYDPHVDWFQYADVNPDADTDADTDADQDTDKHTKPNSNANTDQHAKPNEHTNTNQNANTDKHIDADPNANADQRADANGCHADARPAIGCDASGGCGSGDPCNCCDYRAKNC
jgi:hypothetical protein